MNIACLHFFRKNGEHAAERRRPPLWMLAAGGLMICAFNGCAWFPWRVRPAAATPVAFAVPSLTAAGPPPMLDPALLQRPTAPFTLGPGDKLEIEVLGDPATRADTTVGPDGKIYYYLLPGLEVWGQTLPQVRHLLAQGLQKYVRGNPTLTVTLLGVQSQHVWLIGRLQSPGIYPMTGPTTLLEAIAEAGGPGGATGVASPGDAAAFSPGTAPGATADLRHSFVMRQGRLLPVDFYRLLNNGDLSQNIYLRPDDFVYLPSARTQEVHVLGAVAQPRAVSFAGQLTLVQAVAEAGGTIPDAYVSHVAVVRGSLTNPAIAVVDYQAVLHAKAPDLLLAPGDIVYVPFTPYRTLTRYVDLILQTFARTVGINEGAHAISNRALPVGINISAGPGP